MSISYSGIVGYGSGKATLPSVETWGNNMAILRNPPSSIQTKQYNNHILLTSEITQMIDDSGDRFNEAIMVYPRGVNSMVDVSYDNYGNNGGQRRGNKAAAGLVDGSSNSGKQAFLPYRIMQGGAFRPPARDQRELLPLSRLPRVWTSSYTQPGFADFSKKLQCPTDHEKGTKKSTDVLRWSVRPTMTYKIETPIVENYEVKSVIKKVLQVPTTSGIQSTARFNGEIGKPVKQVIIDPRKADVNLNMGASHMQKDAGLDHMDTGKYTHEVLQGDNNTNLSQNVQVTSIDQLYSMDTSRSTRDANNVYYDTAQTGYTKQDYMHDDVELDRRLPYYESHTNSGRNIHTKFEGQISERQFVPNRPAVEATTSYRGPQTVDNINRQYNLRPTVNPGGFESVPTMPSVDRENKLLDFDNDKSRMRQRVYDMQQDRNTNIANVAYMPQQTPV
jgi:hypothetical protein